ncbi:hypothetical protein Tco_0654396 [Tanacetum coccineum]|uniref:Uncharacterized protein n=1 Tax=Tanacetum coccineum TaxID=301880 RepID=A0ABQ4X331_9ASTR
MSCPLAPNYGMILITSSHMLEPCIRSLLIMTKRRERIEARKDLVSRMLAPPPPLKIILLHLLHDVMVDENDDESFHSNLFSSPSQNVSSSSNVIPRVISNPPHESHHLNTHLSETINLQTQQQDAHRKGLRSIGQAIKNMMKGKRK